MIDDRKFQDPIYKEEISEDRLYYIFNKGKEYITVSGVGDDPNKLEDVRWNSSKGAKGVLKQILEVESGYSPQVGFVKFGNYLNNIIIQSARFGTIYKNGWRYLRSNVGDNLEKMQSKKRVYVKASKRSKAHYRMQTVGREELDPDNVKVEDIPFTYEPTGNKNNDDSINKILTEVRDTCGDDLSEIDKVVDKIIGSSGEEIRVMANGDKDEKFLLYAAMDNVAKLIGKDLLDKINNDPKDVIEISVDKNKTRASGGKKIELGKYDISDIGVIAHEYGHSIEYMIPEISNAARSFRDRRTEGESVVKLADVFPNQGYDEWEETQVDDFMTAYIGKRYSKATEVLSMGMGYLASGNAKKMYKEDPEYFGLIVASLTGKIE